MMHQRLMASGVWASFESHKNDPDSRAEIICGLMGIAERKGFTWEADDLSMAIEAVCDVADRYDFATGEDAIQMIVQVVEMLGWQDKSSLDAMFQPGSPVLN